MGRPNIRTCGVFEGIGGFHKAADDLGGFEWRMSVEVNEDAIAVLKHHWKDTPIHRDIRDFQPKPGEYDLLVGGFPCDGTSRAGGKTGINHPESALFWEFLRCVCECRPKLVLLEQPEGFINRGLRGWIGGLNLAGYRSLSPLYLAADQLGAAHQRARVFVISHALEWRPSVEWNAPSWADKMREVVERQRNQEAWLTVIRQGDVCNPKLPAGLARCDIAAPDRHPGRIRARYLLGKTVTPPQARVALELVKWLWYGDE